MTLTDFCSRQGIQYESFEGREDRIALDVSPVNCSADFDPSARVREEEGRFIIEDVTGDYAVTLCPGEVAKVEMI